MLLRKYTVFAYDSYEIVNNFYRIFLPTEPVLQVFTRFPESKWFHVAAKFLNKLFGSDRELL